MVNFVFSYSLCHDVQWLHIQIGATHMGMTIIKEPKHTHPQLEPNALLLSLHRATFMLTACVLEPVIWPAPGKTWIEEKEVQHRSACLILIGGKELDGKGMAARHSSLGCQEMAIYRWHSMAVCATISTLHGSYLCVEERFFPLQVCAAWARRRKHQRSEHLGHLCNFLFTRGWYIDPWGQKNKIHRSDSHKNIAVFTTYR